MNTRNKYDDAFKEVLFELLLEKKPFCAKWGTVGAIYDGLFTDLQLRLDRNMKLTRAKIDQVIRQCREHLKSEYAEFPAIAPEQVKDLIPWQMTATKYFAEEEAHQREHAIVVKDKADKKQPVKDDSRLLEVFDKEDLNTSMSGSQGPSPSTQRARKGKRDDVDAVIAARLDIDRIKEERKARKLELYHELELKRLAAAEEQQKLMALILERLSK
ncbi:hypothetical protein J8273_2236 [Carpediemonas membranifera]|uniref:Uncharacterized protein n=1 Tax=Carpediemonas membranifera TaxID=201153 RepID=A0A8J6BZV0_9EUKA|nr:hypothetical protein J8273_2236 [Carpediemonas membranifera]|eukprot:KAG9395901.1 hypothetical protein J8273_2236 [Carpediemonas membranifera]